MNSGEEEVQLVCHASPHLLMSHMHSNTLHLSSPFNTLHLFPNININIITSHRTS